MIWLRRLYNLRAVDYILMNIIISRRRFLQFAGLSAAIPASISLAAPASSAMGADKFWHIVDSTTVFENDQQAQMGLLHQTLLLLSADEIVAFENTFNAMRRRAYSWELWGAAYIMNNGFGADDDFEYFMRWLVSKGRRIFEMAIANPDSLADIKLSPDPEGIFEFEEFAYVAARVWKEKTGIDPLTDVDGRYPYTGADPADHLAGTKFSTESMELARRYPRLWKRFGHGK